jgi:F0F1-type ATP synthase delta subunit
MAELATIARPYAEALFKAAVKADAALAAAWLDELAPWLRADAAVAAVCRQPQGHV